MWRSGSPWERIKRRVMQACGVVFSLYLVQISVVVVVGTLLEEEGGEGEEGEGEEMRVPSFSNQASRRSSRARWRAAARRRLVFVRFVGVATLSLGFPSSLSSSGVAAAVELLSSSTLKLMLWALEKDLTKFSRRVQSCWNLASMALFWRVRFS